jgi:hypothetical protein
LIGLWVAATLAPGFSAVPARMLHLQHQAQKSPAFLNSQPINLFNYMIKNS